MRPAHILIALAMISVASAGPAIHQDNGTVVFYVDATTIPRLDKAEGIIFAVYGGL